MKDVRIITSHTDSEWNNFLYESWEYGPNLDRIILTFKKGTLPGRKEHETSMGNISRLNK